jgi:hypothetical protein
MKALSLVQVTLLQLPHPCMHKNWAMSIVGFLPFACIFQISSSINNDEDTKINSLPAKLDQQEC